MNTKFTQAQFSHRFPTEKACLEAVKNFRYPEGIQCKTCRKITTYYKVKNRTSYSCGICRMQVYPLASTIFEKSATPLTKWFYAIFLMVQTKGDLSVKLLQEELVVTYKTAWRIHKSINVFMKDLQLLPQDMNETLLESLVRQGAIKLLQVEKHA